MLIQVLEEFLQIDGVTSAALIGQDGFLIQSVGSEPIDTEELAVLGSCAMNFFSKAGAALNMGKVRQFVLESRNGNIIFTRINDEEMLAVMTASQSAPGHITFILPKITTRVAAVI